MPKLDFAFSWLPGGLLECESSPEVSQRVRLSAGLAEQVTNERSSPSPQATRVGATVAEVVVSGLDNVLFAFSRWPGPKQ